MFHGDYPSELMQWLFGFLMNPAHSHLRTMENEYTWKSHSAPVWHDDDSRMNLVKSILFMTEHEK